MSAPCLTHTARKAVEKATAALRAIVAAATDPEEKAIAQEFLDAATVYETRMAIRRDIEDARAKAALKAVADQEAAIIREAIRTDAWDALTERYGDYSAPLKEGADFLASLQTKMRNKNGNGGAMSTHYFVTVNPKPDVKLSELQAAVKRYVKSKMIRKVSYVYEQRGANFSEMGKGMHVHMLIEQSGEVMSTAFKQRSVRSFRNLCGTEHHVDVRPVKADWVEDKMAYIRGEKTGEGKADRVTVDKQWRENNFLQPMYELTNGSGSVIPKGFSRKTLTASEASDDGATSHDDEASSSASRRATVD